LSDYVAAKRDKKWWGQKDGGSMSTTASVGRRLYERWAALDRGWRAACLGLGTALVHVAV
jgi:hypothetical protein